MTDKKTELINKINEAFNLNDTTSFGFMHNPFVINNDYSKYDVVFVCRDDDGEVTVETVGYNSFSLKVFNIKDFSYNTIKKIYTQILYYPNV